MKTSPAGVALIQHFESLELKAYLCSALVPTIGWGHTGKDVHLGLTITRERADELLLRDLAAFEAGVGRLVKVALNVNQFSALVAFAFNVGLDEDEDTAAEGLGDSTLLRKLNQGDFAGVVAEFPKWNKCRGKTLRGLVTRRAAEQALFLTPPGNTFRLPT